MSTSTATGCRKPGRPRDADADEAILSATIRLLSEQGYQAMTMGGIAAAAGVGKPTVYRRYRSKAQLVAAALIGLTTGEEPVRSASSQEAIVVLLRGAAGILADPGVRTIFGSLLAEARRDPELVGVFRDRVFRPRRALVQAVLRDGIARGEIALDADVEVIDTLLFGAVLARSILDEPGTDDWLRRLVTSVWSGVAPR